MNNFRKRLLAAEERRIHISSAGKLRVGVGYPNTYRVAMSSLAYQWVVELTASCPDVGVERFFSDQPGEGRSLDGNTPLGDFDVLAWSCSFELDAANLLRTLTDAGIPLRREDRSHRDPLLIVGGALASINPLPLSPAIDIFVLGSAELLWSPLLELISETPDRGRLLDELATRDGYFIPLHHLSSDGWPLQRRRRVEKRDSHMNSPAMVPISHAVTPNTEYRGRGLVEMSRGCPEKCRYCWVSYNYGRLRCYSTEGILDGVERLRTMTQRIGFVATAVGDHPRLPEILEACRSKDLNVALSSLRIPAMREEILRPLAESGARSVTIAPETGSDALRLKLNKPITNDSILEAVDVAQRCGIYSLKMYFIIGLPGEAEGDILSIADLLRQTQKVMLSRGRKRGQLGNLLAGFSVLVPKPYTPYAREAMLSRREARRRISLIETALTGIPNLRITRPSYREAQWQAFLSRGGISVYPGLELAASGMKLTPLLTELKKEVEASTLKRVEGDPQWQFITSAPQKTSV